MEKVFFAFPFELDRHEDYRLVLQRACSDLGVEAVFGDKIRQSDALIRKMCDAIDECNHSFFDITGFNPNVMIEVGIAFRCQKPIYLLYHAEQHRRSAAAKALRMEVPSDLQGHERFTYKNLAELDRELRMTLRQALGQGRNLAFELKEKIRRVLRAKPQPIREIVSTLGGSEPDIQQALAALRFEQSVEIEGHGAGAKWRLTAH
ncbi:MAG: hypothetical protein ABL864_12280 [Terricaulis sp.]